MVWCSYCVKDQVAERDDINGFTCCTGCGRVLDDNVYASDPTFTKTACGQSQVEGNFIRDGQSSLGRLGNGAGRTFGYQSDSHEKTLNKGKHEIVEIIERLSIRPRDDTATQAHRFYTIALERNFTRGRRTQQVAAACIYIVCRQMNKPYMLIDFSDCLQTNVYVLGAVFLQLCSLLRLEEQPFMQKPVDPSLFIHRFADRLQFGKKLHPVSNTALRLVASMKRDWMQTGRRPSGICGAALFISAHIHGFDRSKADVVSVVHICEATLKKRLVEFESTESGSLTASEFEIKAQEIEDQVKGAVELYTHSGSKGITDITCEHKDIGAIHFAHGLCRECYEEFVRVSGGMHGGSAPPAFQRAELERLEAVRQQLRGQGLESDEEDDDFVPRKKGSDPRIDQNQMQHLSKTTSSEVCGQGQGRARGRGRVRGRGRGRARFQERNSVTAEDGTAVTTRGRGRGRGTGRGNTQGVDEDSPNGDNDVLAGAETGGMDDNVGKSMKLKLSCEERNVPEIIEALAADSLLQETVSCKENDIASFPESNSFEEQQERGCVKEVVSGKVSPLGTGNVGSPSLENGHRTLDSQCCVIDRQEGPRSNIVPHESMSLGDADLIVNAYPGMRLQSNTQSTNLVQQDYNLDTTRVNQDNERVESCSSPGNASNMPPSQIKMSILDEPSQDANAGENPDENEETLSDIDDDELTGYIHNEEEVRLKTIIWTEMNKEYLQEQQIKEAALAATEEARQAAFAAAATNSASAAELAAVAAAAVAKMKKDRKQKRADEAKRAPAESAAEATRQMLESKKLSTKVDYSVLAKLFDAGEESEMQGNGDKLTLQDGDGDSEAPESSGKRMRTSSQADEDSVITQITSRRSQLLRDGDSEEGCINVDTIEDDEEEVTAEDGEFDGGHDYDMEGNDDYYDEEY